MPVMNHSNYSPAGRRPGAPVKIVWSVEEDQQLLQVLCMLHLALRGTPPLHHHRVHSTWRVKGWSRQGALAAALGPCIWCIVRPLVLSCLLPPPSCGSLCTRSGRVGRRSPRSFPVALASSAENGASHSASQSTLIAWRVAVHYMMYIA
jgi:hypothetical protein